MLLTWYRSDGYNNHNVIVLHSSRGNGPRRLEGSLRMEEALGLTENASHLK